METLAANLNPKIVKGMADYHRPRSEGSIDLVKMNRDILSDFNLSNKIPVFENDRFIKDAEQKDTNVQRYLLNRYWTQQLIMSKKPCIEERYALLPDGSIEEWVNMFRHVVMPFIAANNLPISLT